MRQIQIQTFMERNPNGTQMRKMRKVLLVVGSLILEPTFVQQSVLQIPYNAMIPSVINFILTYGYDWGLLSAPVALSFVLLYAWYFPFLAFVPFLLSTFAYEPLIRMAPWSKNMFVAFMYSLNFVVLPWTIAATTLPTRFILAYFLRVIAFEMHDDLQDWEEDVERGRKTLVQIVGRRPSRFLIHFLLVCSGMIFGSRIWRCQTCIDVIGMILFPGIALGRGWVLLT